MDLYMIVENVLSVLPLGEIERITAQDPELDTVFRQYVSSGYYVANMYPEEVDVTLLPDMEAALLPYDPMDGYPNAYHLILDLYRRGFISTLPIQVEEMALIDVRSMDIRRYNPNITLLNDWRLVLKHDLLSCASPRIRDDPDIAREIAMSRPHYLYYMSDSIKDNKEVAMFAVSLNGNALEYVSDRLKDDQDVVLAAYNRSKTSIRYASDRHRNNKDVILRLVSEDGTQYEHMSEVMKADIDIARAAYNNYPYMLKHIPKSRQWKIRDLFS